MFRAALLLLVACACYCETIQDIILRTPSWRQVSVVAPNGTFLGTLEPSQFAQLSIFNQQGAHGSPFGMASMRNEHSLYGGAYGLYSPSNPYCVNPPMLVANGVPVAYISNNEFLAKGPRLTLAQVMALPSMYAKP